MSRHLGDCPPADVERVLRSWGFAHARTSGGHAIFKKDGHRLLITVPQHRVVKRGTLRAIIAAAGRSVEEFLDALQS